MRVEGARKYRRFGRRRRAAVDVDALYKEYGPVVYRRILRFFHGAEAEDVLQEVFVLVVEKLDSFRADASPSTWLYRITTNHCLNRLKLGNRRRELMREHGPGLWPAFVSAPDQETMAFTRELWRDVPHELLELGVHYYVDGMTHGEIARVLGVSRRTVGNRLVELRRRARACAGGDDGDSGV